MKTYQDDDEMQTVGSIQDLGEIRPDIWQVGYLYVIRGPKPIQAFNPVDKIHEQSKKVVPHSVQLGAEVPTKPADTVQTAKVSEQVTFIFCYRPLDILQANGMAPATIKRPASPSPPPKPEPEPSEDDADEKIAALEEQIRQIRERKKNKAKVEVKRKFKQEGSHLNGEVIDLTED